MAMTTGRMRKRPSRIKASETMTPDTGMPTFNSYIENKRPAPLRPKCAGLADQARRAILARLALGEATVTELAEPFPMSLPAVSKHLKVLQRAGLIARGLEAQWRPCRLEAAPLKDAADWIEHYRRFWGESFDPVDEYLSEFKTREKNGRKR